MPQKGTGSTASRKRNQDMVDKVNTNINGGGNVLKKGKTKYTAFAPEAGDIEYLTRSGDWVPTPAQDWKQHGSKIKASGKSKSVDYNLMSDTDVIITTPRGREKTISDRRWDRKSGYGKLFPERQSSMVKTTRSGETKKKKISNIRAKKFVAHAKMKAEEQSPGSTRGSLGDKGLRWKKYDKWGNLFPTSNK